MQTRRNFLLGTTALVAAAALPALVLKPDPAVWRIVTATGWKEYTVQYEARIADDPASRKRLSEEMSTA